MHYVFFRIVFQKSTTTNNITNLFLDFSSYEFMKLRGINVWFWKESRMKEEEDTSDRERRDDDYMP